MTVPQPSLPLAATPSDASPEETGNDPSSAPALAERLEKIWSSPHNLFGWLGTVDHKRIGIRYLVTSIAFLGVGGVEAVLMRLQLIGPRRDLLSPEAYNQIFTMHGMTMIFWYAAPVLSGFGNYFVPLLIGSRDMAFPRLNAFSYWMFLTSGLLLYVSVLFGQAPDAGCKPPKFALAIALLVILLISSGTAWAAEHLLSRGSRRGARGLLIATIVLGLLFIAVQVLEYLDRLRELKPTTDAYGSLFYVITSFHGLHVVVGLLFLGFVALLPNLDPDRSPHRPLHNAVLYWHFVDAVWVFVVGLLYILPQWSR